MWIVFPTTDLHGVILCTIEILIGVFLWHANVCAIQTLYLTNAEYKRRRKSSNFIREFLFVGYSREIPKKILKYYYRILVFNAVLLLWVLVIFVGGLPHIYYFETQLIVVGTNAFLLILKALFMPISRLKECIPEPAERKTKKCGITEEIYIYQYIQDITDMKKMKKWFDSQNYLEDQKEILKHLINMLDKSKATYEEIEEVIHGLNVQNLKFSYRMLNKNRPYAKHSQEVLKIKLSEMEIVFEVLLLSLAKAERRNQSQDTSNNKWWYKDLCDQNYLASLIKS